MYEYKLSSEELIQNANTVKTVLLKKLFDDGILTKEQMQQLDSNYIVTINSDEKGVFYEVIKLIKETE